MNLSKKLTLPFLIFYGVGMILGAGIYSIIGAAAGEAKESLWISFMISSVMALLTGLSYCELATMFPKAGAEYVFLRNTFPKIPGLSVIVGLLVATAGASTAAAVSIAFAGYLSHFISISYYVVALILLALFTLINILGIKESSWANVIFTLIEVAGLVIFIGIGVKHQDLLAPFSSKFHMGVISASSLITFSYFGFENIVNLSEEANNPGQDLPRAILWSLGIATVLYILVSLAAVELMPPEELAKSNKPLTDATLKYSQTISGILTGIALFSTANTALISLLTVSRILFSMSREKDLPQGLGVLLPKRKTPWVASITVLIFSSLFLPLGEVKEVASVSAIVTLLSFISVNACVIVLRKTDPSLSRPFKIPGEIKKVPVAPVLSGVICIIMLFNFPLKILALSFTIILVFSLFYFLRKKFS